MQLKRNIKFFVVLLTSSYSAWLLAQAQPQANGAALNETAPSEVTTVDPMDPARDSRMGSDATMGDRRARGPVSGTVVAPETQPPQTVPSSTY